MANGKLEFDGAEYLDGSASDPNTLGWMQGSPPAAAKRIRFEDDEVFKFPQLRWSLSHMRELLPSVAVHRGLAMPSELGAPVRAAPGIDAAGFDAAGFDAAGIDALAFDDLLGKRCTWKQALLDAYTDGILVLHRGRCVYERYFGALQPRRQHACFSITKSYVATIAAALLHEKVLDQDKAIAYYLPEMRGTAYEDATLRQVLDMQVAVRYSEAYADPAAEVWNHARAVGARPRPAGYTGPTNSYDYLVTLRKEGSHGAAFDYKTPNTEVLAWVMTRVTGTPLEELLSNRLWSRLGCEEDGYFAVDSIGTALGGGGLNVTLRDMARFGELMRLQGAWAGQQVIPAAVVADIRRGADPAKFGTAGYTLLPGYSYRDMWWVAPAQQGVFEGRGIYGQRLHVALEAEVVIARFASHPIASSAANDILTLPAFAAVCRLLR